MSVRDLVVAQFKNPSGLSGHVVGWIMATRHSNRERSRWTVDLLDVDPHDRVLELGCGPGLALQNVARRLQSGSVVGIDHSPVMVRQATRRNREGIDARKILVRVGAIEDIHAVGGAFTKIFSVNVIQFMPDKTAFFRLLHDKLAPGGIVATTYQPRNRNPTRADAIAVADRISAAMKLAGFADIRVEERDFQPPAVCVIGARPE